MTNNQTEEFRKNLKIKLGEVEFPIELVKAALSNKLVVFAGAGVSMGHPSDMPSFSKLVKDVFTEGGWDISSITGKKTTDEAGKEIKVFYDDRDLGKLETKKVNVNRVVARMLNCTGLQPTDLHKSILRLFSSPEKVKIVTTNSEYLFEKAAKKEFGEKKAKDIKIWSAPAMPNGKNFQGIVHLHGENKDPENLVFTDTAFAKAYMTRGWARNFLEDLFQTFTVLFIGYSHNDTIISYLSRALDKRESLFALEEIEENNASQKSKWDFLGIDYIPFELTESKNRYENLYNSTKELGDSNLNFRLGEVVEELLSTAPDKKTDSFIGKLELVMSDNIMAERLLEICNDNSSDWFTILAERGCLSSLFLNNHVEDKKESQTLSHTCQINWFRRIIHKVDDLAYKLLRDTRTLSREACRWAFFTATHCQEAQIRSNWLPVLLKDFHSCFLKDFIRNSRSTGAHLLKRLVAQESWRLFSEIYRITIEVNRYDPQNELLAIVMEQKVQNALLDKLIYISLDALEASAEQNCMTEIGLLRNRGLLNEESITSPSACIEMEPIYPILFALFKKFLQVDFEYAFILLKRLDQVKSEKARHLFLIIFGNIIRATDGSIPDTSKTRTYVLLDGSIQRSIDLKHFSLLQLQYSILKETPHISETLSSISPTEIKHLLEENKREVFNPPSSCLFDFKEYIEDISNQRVDEMNPCEFWDAIKETSHVTLPEFTPMKSSEWIIEFVEILLQNGVHSYYYYRDLFRRLLEIDPDSSQWVKFFKILKRADPSMKILEAYSVLISEIHNVNSGREEIEAPASTIARELWFELRNCSTANQTLIALYLLMHWRDKKATGEANNSQHMLDSMLTDCGAYEKVLFCEVFRDTYLMAQVDDSTHEFMINRVKEDKDLCASAWDSFLSNWDIRKPHLPFLKNYPSPNLHILNDSSRLSNFFLGAIINTIASGKQPFHYLQPYLTQKESANQRYELSGSILSIFIPDRFDRRILSQLISSPGYWSWLFEYWQSRTNGNPAQLSEYEKSCMALLPFALPVDRFSEGVQLTEKAPPTIYPNLQGSLVHSVYLPNFRDPEDFFLYYKDKQSSPEPAISNSIAKLQIVFLKASDFINTLSFLQPFFDIECFPQYPDNPELLCELVRLRHLRGLTSPKEALEKLRELGDCMPSSHDNQFLRDNIAELLKVVQAPPPSLSAEKQ